MNRAYLSLGSNIEPVANLRAAITMLAAQTRLLAVSSVWETAPLGITDQPNFLNMAALVEIELSAEQLKRDVLRRIETALHRNRTGHRYGPRTIDIDLMLFNRDIFDLDGHHIPNSEVLERAFVAIPLAEISPEYRHPETGQTLAAIAADFDIEKEKMFLRHEITFDIPQTLVPSQEPKKEK